MAHSANSQAQQATATRSAHTAQTELSNTRVSAKSVKGGVLTVNDKLVQQTMAARSTATRFIQPRPSAPMCLYTNPDGTLCSDRRQVLAYDNSGNGPE